MDLCGFADTMDLVRRGGGGGWMVEILGGPEFAGKRH